METEIYSRRNLRLRLFYFLYVLFGIILIAGLFYRQIILYDFYKEQQIKQNHRRILLPGPRGNILDREGRILVGNRPLFNAVIYLNELRSEYRKEYIRLVKQARELDLATDRQTLQRTARITVTEHYLQKLNRILGRSEPLNIKAFERHYSQMLLLPFSLIKDLSSEEYARLIDHIPIDSPIQVQADSARVYPFGNLAAHTLGFVVSEDAPDEDNLPGDDLRTFRLKGKKGKSGIEKSHDDLLNGTSGGEIWMVDPSGKQFERTEFVAPEKGRDFRSSLDLDLQLMAEKSMGKKIGAAVCLDVHTGEVLTMASKPDYDLNELSPILSFATDKKIREQNAWLNRALQGLYPPGSTFKVITAIAGLKSGAIQEGTIIDCPGYYMVGKRRFNCHKLSGHGRETLEEAIRDSCNVYFYQSGLKMGVEKIAAEARLFGLNERTGIDLPGETRGMLIPDPQWKMNRLYDNWYSGDTANLSIGQGFTLITPLQMGCVAASIARGQTRTTPTLVYQLNKRSHSSPSIDISERAFKRVLEGMRLAGSTGTARLAAPEGMSISGKTGTAQVRVKGHELTLAWFMGFAPSVNPQVAVVVMIEGTDPNDNFHGGSTAAPIARDIFTVYFRKKGLIPR
jgi:penicillin-binding protein 2